LFGGEVIVTAVDEHPDVQPLLLEAGTIRVFRLTGKGE